MIEEKRMNWKVQEIHVRNEERNDKKKNFIRGKQDYEQQLKI